MYVFLNQISWLFFDKMQNISKKIFLYFSSIFSLGYKNNFKILYYLSVIELKTFEWNLMPFYQKNSQEIWFCIQKYKHKSILQEQ